MGLLSLLFGKSNNDITEFLKKGAVILDVRSKREWNGGHIEGAIHIPVQELENRINEIKKLNKSVIAHCASGMRSANAANLLKSHGIDAINGGGIGRLRSKLG